MINIYAQERGSSRLLGNLDLSEETRLALSELFPSIRRGCINVNYKKDDEGKYRIIDSIIIKGSIGSGGSPLAEGEEGRRRIANSWLKEQLSQMPIGRDYRDVMQKITKTEM